MMLKKFFTAIVLVILLVQNICVAAVINGGNCGNGVRWSFEDNGTLTISGRGNMSNYLIENTGTEKDGWFYLTPWNDIKMQIIKIVVQEGVTGIGSHAFADLDNLKTATIANSVAFIGSQAFSGCKNFESINIPPNAQLGKDVFLACKKLSNISTVDNFGKTLAVSQNVNSNNYTHWANPVKSYLYADGANLVRVENIGSKILIEKYSQDFKLISSQDLNLNFEIWGGFYAGKNFNFVITGKDNIAESDSNEVIKISKFDKNWKLLGEKRILGADTIRPFEAGSLRCAESDGKLYIHTCHQMYNKHQSNMSIVLNETDMNIIRLDCHVERGLMGYVSHSFNQFILIDSQKNPVMFNHGDAYPRGAILIRFINAADYVELLNWEGTTGDNTTGGAIGGLAETNNNYVTAYNYDGIGSSQTELANKRTLFVSFTAKNNFSKAGTKTVKFSHPDKNFSYGTPFVIAQNLSGGYIICSLMKFDGKIFSPTDKIVYAKYNDNGASEVQISDGQLSDCQPIIFNGKVVWYVTNNSAPTFYTLDEGGVTSHKL